LPAHADEVIERDELLPLLAQNRNAVAVAARLLLGDQRTPRGGHTCAVAFSRMGNPATGDFRDATVLQKFGDVPDDLSAL
jgi:hypothetical protein